MKKTDKKHESALNPKNYEFTNVFGKLESSPEGLKTQEAEFRLKKFGPNQIEEKKKKSIFIKIAEEFKDIMVIILIIAATIALATHEITDAIIIYAVVVINGLIGFIQKNRAEKAIDALKKMVSPQARVIRDNNHQSIIDTENLVPGDILVLNEGDTITADAILFEENEFQTQEAVLTGESTPVSKDTVDPNNKEQTTSVHHFLFKGTTVAHGNGKAIVVRTGMETEFGKIASLTQETKKDLSPLEKELRRIGLFTAKVTLSITAIIFLFEVIMRGREFLNTVIFAASIAVAAVPEGLPATITIALALGVQRLSKKNAIVKQLSSVETLGATTVICSDKTGTLTRNQMTVTTAFVDDYYLDFESNGYDPTGVISFEKNQKQTHVYDMKKSQAENLETLSAGNEQLYKSLEWLSLTALLCNNAEIVEKDGKHIVLGDPTEGALITMAQKIGFDLESVKDIFEKVHELPFDSDRKIMTQIVRNKENNKYYALTKGAPDNVIMICDQRFHQNRTTILTDKIREELIVLNEEYAKSALRTIGYAFRELDKKTLKTLEVNDNFQENIQLIEKNLNFIGISGMIDPPRDEVKEAVKMTKQAGIRTYILTGDHGLTAGAIAKQIGIISDERKHEIISGQELSAISDFELKRKLQDTELDIIFSRISPEHKLRIVALLKENDEVVAVTGDGVNDAPALKRADIGVAMGITGTDVSKEASNMVLADDSFSSIVLAIREGRTIYDNLKKFIFYIFSSNIGEVFTIFVSIVIGLFSPLTAVLILTVNLATDLFPALALGVEPTEKDIMNKPPRPPHQKIMNAKFIGRFAFIGVTIGLIMISLYAYELFQNGWVYGTEIPTDLYRKASSMAFAALVMIQVANAFNARHATKSIFQVNHLRNLNFIWANIFSVIICVAVLHLPLLQPYFKTSALNANEWGLIIASSILVIILEEIRKLIVRMNGKSSKAAKAA